MVLSKWIGIFLLSSTKFLLAIVGVWALKVTWWQAVLVTSLGGVFGVVFYLFGFEYVTKFFKILVNKYAKPTEKVKQNFSKWRRFMVKLRQKGGLFGISILTPMLLSIPVGVAISLTLGSTKKRILVFHCISVVAWSLLMVTLKFVFGVDGTQYFVK